MRSWAALPLNGSRGYYPGHAEWVGVYSFIRTPIDISDSLTRMNEA